MANFRSIFMTIFELLISLAIGFSVVDLITAYLYNKVIPLYIVIIDIISLGVTVAFVCSIYLNYIFDFIIYRQWFLGIIYSYGLSIYLCIILLTTSIYLSHVYETLKNSDKKDKDSEIYFNPYAIIISTYILSLVLALIVYMSNIYSNIIIGSLLVLFYIFCVLCMTILIILCFDMVKICVRIVRIKNSEKQLE